MNQNQIKKASDTLLVNRYKWLAGRLDKLNPILSAHDNGTGKIENHHHLNKLRKESDRLYDEMELVEKQMQVRRDAQKKLEPQQEKV